MKSDMTANNEAIPFCLWRSALLICSQSFLFGYVFSCLNTCLMTGDDHDGSKCYHDTDSSCPPGTIYDSFNLTATEAQLATALTVLGAWVGSLLGSKPAERYGRRFTLLCNNAFFIAGALLSASGVFALLFLGRLISGFGVGIASSVPAVLLSEIASENSKGTITTLHQLNITIAIFVAAVVGYGFVTYVNNGWQYVLGLGCLPCFVFIAFYQFIPESPKWLLGKGRRDEAMRMLRMVRAPQTSDSALMAEMDDILKADGNNKDNNKDNNNNNNRNNNEDDHVKSNMGKSSEDEGGTWKELFGYRKSVIIGCGLMVFQTLTGINAVIFYSTNIFAFAGFDQAIIATTLVGLVNFLATLFSNYFIDKVGRKTLLGAGTSIMAVALMVLAIVLLAGSGSVSGMVAVITILVYIIGFAIGLGAVAWVLMSEVIPTRVRSKAMSLFLCVNWGLNLIISLTTLSAINGLGNVTDDDAKDDDSAKSDAQKKGVAYLFIIFAGFAVLCLVFLGLYVPETKGKKIEDLIDDTRAPLLQINDEEVN